MNYNSKYTGQQVEDLLDQVASGNAGGGGGGGITVETDPIFSASPAASITEDNKAKWDSKYAKPSGGIPKSDLASDVQASLSNADNAVQKGMVGTLNIIEVEGVYDGEYVYALPTAAAKNANEDYDDIILSRGSVKTINGESIFGIGDITISGGSGEQGPKGDKGDTGVGVQSVKQTTTSNVDSGYNVVTVTLTNGTTSTFSVKNGSKGSTGADGATFTPSVDSAGNLSWSNNKGLTNPPTVNIKGPKGDKGDAGEGGGGSGGSGKEIVLSQYIHFDDTNPIQPNKIYISSIAMTAMYIGAFQEVSNYDEYCIIFKYPEEGVTLPESVKFANGQIPTIEYNTECELSVVGIGSGANRTYHAVLTPFKTL